MRELRWIFELKEKVPEFLRKLKGHRIPGFSHYSLSGDLYGEEVKWGLANTVYTETLRDWTRWICRGIMI